MKRLISIMLSVVMLFSSVVPFAVFAEQQKISTLEAAEIQTAVNLDIRGAINYLSIEQTVANSYSVHALAKAGGNVTKYILNLEENVKANAGKIKAKQQNETEDTESLVYYAVAIDTLSYLGLDASNFAGYDIKNEFENFAQTNSAVSNPYFYRCIIEACSVIKNDTLGKAFANQMCQSYTMGKGFDYWGYSCDNTSVFVASLAPYKSEYKSYIDDAVKLIASYKKEKGYYSDSQYVTTENANSTAMALMAYASVDEQDYAYGAYKLLTANFESKSNNGVFTLSGVDNAYATVDALRALPYFDATQIVHSFDGNVCTACGEKRKTASTSTSPTTSTTPTSSTSKPNSIKDTKSKISKISTGKKSITLKWKQMSGVSAYQVQIATDKKFKKNKKTFKVSKKSNKAKISKLKAKKIYYVRLRAYKTVNGKKTYSQWSVVRKVKTK